MSVAHASDIKADLQLQFATSPDDRTYVNHQYCRYPFHICRAQYVDANPSGLATLYLQSSAGGIFENDRLLCEVHALPDSCSHITTQASTIVHRMDNGDAYQHISIRAEEKSFLEYLPDPMILFPKANIFSGVTIRMHPSATVLLTDAFTSHDPTTYEQSFSEFRNETRVESLDGRLLCLDRYQVSGSQFAGEQIGVMGNNNVQGTFMILNQNYSASELCELLRKYLDNQFDGYAGVSALPNGCGVWVRLIACEVFNLRAATQELWSLARQALMGERPHKRKK